MEKPSSRAGATSATCGPGGTHVTTNPLWGPGNEAQRSAGKVFPYVSVFEPAPRLHTFQIVNGLLQLGYRSLGELRTGLCLWKHRTSQNQRGKKRGSTSAPFRTKADPSSLRWCLCRSGPLPMEPPAHLLEFVSENLYLFLILVFFLRVL